jgi:type IV pilus assembly protein PilZ
MDNITVEFRNDKALYDAYMPFLANGGLFVQTDQSYTMGDEMMLHVSLPDSLEASKVSGQVCWVTPMGAQNGTPSGIGINFVDDPEQVRNQIEKSIGRLLNSAEPTLTM